jgi:membrane-bound lytic murein transglycosylase D
VKGSEYELKVPVGTAGILSSRLSTAPSSELGALKWYTVRRGETLAGIARKFKVKRVDLAEANNLLASSRVRPSQNLIIPVYPATLLAARAERRAPTTVASRSIEGSAEVADVERASNVQPVTYRVKRGDTLFSIAQLFNTTVERLKSLNRLRTSRIAVGDRLTVRPR